MAAAALAAITVSCAYYNILWTANKEYDKATATLAFAEFRDPYEQGELAGEQVKLVESAASRCGKMLVLYPDSKWVDDALLLMGKCFLLQHEYEKALKKFREINTLYSDDDLADEARYLEAYTLILQDSEDEAISLLQDLRKTAKDDLIREKAGYLLPRVAFERGDCLAAVDAYVSYLEDHPEGDQAAGARLRLGECQVRLGMYREAVADLEPLLDELDEQGARALLTVGKAYRMLEERDEALDAFHRVFDGAGEDTLRSRAGIEEALTLLHDGRPEEAIETLARADSVGARKLTSEIHYRTGYIYERDLGDFDQAVAHYDEALKKSSEYSGSAARRSRALKNLKKYQDDISTGTGDPAKNRYLLAETYLYDLGLTDMAVAELQAVCDSFPDCEYAARSMLAIASHLEAGGDTRAASYYEKIIEDFPETPYANVARAALGLPPVDVVIVEPAPQVVPDRPAPDTLGATPDTLGIRPGERASRDRIPPDAAPLGPEPPEGVRDGTVPAAGDTLAGADSLGAGEEYARPFESFPGVPDSVRSRYEEYSRYEAPQPDEEDTGVSDTTGLRTDEEE